MLGTHHPGHSRRHSPLEVELDRIVGPLIGDRRQHPDSLASWLSQSVVWLARRRTKNL